MFESFMRRAGGGEGKGDRRRWIMSVTHDGMHAAFRTAKVCYQYSARLMFAMRATKTVDMDC